MNKHFNIEDAEHESDWKDLTIMRLLAEVSDLEDKIDKAIEYIEENCIDDEFEVNLTKKEKEIIKVLDILKGDDKDE